MADDSTTTTTTSTSTTSTTTKPADLTPLDEAIKVATEQEWTVQVLNPFYRLHRFTAPNGTVIDAGFAQDGTINHATPQNFGHEKDSKAWQRKADDLFKALIHTFKMSKETDDDKNGQDA